MLLECVFLGEAQTFAVSHIYLQISAERVGKFHSMIPVQHILFKVYHGTIVIIFALILANFCLETFWLVSSVYS